MDTHSQKGLLKSVELLRILGQSEWCQASTPDYKVRHSACEHALTRLRDGLLTIRYAKNKPS